MSRLQQQWEAEVPVVGQRRRGPWRHLADGSDPPTIPREKAVVFQMAKTHHCLLLLPT